MSATEGDDGTSIDIIHSQSFVLSLKVKQFLFFWSDFINPYKIGKQILAAQVTMADITKILNRFLKLICDI